MKRVNVNISAPNLTTICIDRVVEERYIGRMYHKYQCEFTEFNGVEQLFTLIDELCDKSGYPQRTTKKRTFRTKKEITSREEALQVMDIDHVLDQKGSMATFVVHVKYRQHSTWQGEVVWAEKNEKQTFRSALELLKLIDNALEDEEEHDMKNNTEKLFMKGE